MYTVRVQPKGDTEEHIPLLCLLCCVRMEEGKRREEEDEDKSGEKEI